MVAIRVRARALDMLGRQQIAGVPTAISELFKNAHDAYAHNVEVDFFRRTGLFVLRDDGIGMSSVDFEERWLTLGTESKLGAGFGIAPPPIDPDQPPRPIMGEKGIGRLAIAAIGPQALVLTRAKAAAPSDALVAAFVHWGMFTLPGVDLADIQIPVRVFSGGRLPSAGDVAGMVDEVRTNLAKVGSKLPSHYTAPVEAELDRFVMDPPALYARLPPGPLLVEEGHGTHFLILPTEDTLPDDIDGGRDDDAAPPLIKALLGFTNTMTPGHEPPAIMARFRDHGLDGTVNERIAGSAFFTPDEFRQADHHVAGEFDEFGQFRGTVGVYGSDPVEYLLPWPQTAGAPLLCGPFQINFAYVQGEARVTKLPPEDHARMIAKLNRIGGLYIYRDGIRILPYGNSDYDFLNIEQRRTKSASYYFFSYRRIFGIINVTRSRNPNLVEKAGREGFRENKAYRQLRRLLENFFTQLAAEFFREGGLRADEFIETRTELERNELLRRKRALQVRGRRDDFASRLDAFFEGANARLPELEVEDALHSAEGRFVALAAQDARRDLPQLVMDLESETYRDLARIDDVFRVTRPRGVGLTRQLQRDWEAYQAERARLDDGVFKPASIRVSELVSQYAVRTRADLDHRRRLDRTLKDVGERERRKTGSVQREARSELEQVQERVLALTREGLSTVETAIRETVMEFERTNTTALNPTSFETLRAELEQQITQVAEREVANLQRLRDQLKTIGTEEGLEQPDLTEALEEELEELRAKEFAGLQLAQVGMALGIVHHEFASTIHGVRNSLRRMKPWADANGKLNPLYQEVRSSFDHLDGYLTLFAPLDRRLQRRRVRITGAEIHRFLGDLFVDRLKRHSVDLRASDAFREMAVIGYPSSFYPCFVNLIDNAIFWVSREPADQRYIELDSDGSAFTVTDSGPGIRPRDAEAVFEMGFTRRPSGRGMGLYISRQVLGQIGYVLTLDPYTQGRGATFRIAPAVGDGATLDTEEPDSADSEEARKSQ
ncbi:MAG TPA: ATP-binding protein [Caulobacteraceae bacterium]|jgi:signal transduction histidine kinase